MHWISVSFISLAVLTAAAPIPQGSVPVPIKGPWPYEYYTGWYPKPPPNVQRRDPAPIPAPDGPSPWPYEYYYGRYPKPPAVQRREASPVKIEERDSTPTSVVPSASPSLVYSLGRVPEGVKAPSSFKVGGPVIGPFGPITGPVPGPDPF